MRPGISHSDGDGFAWGGEEARGPHGEKVRFGVGEGADDGDGAGVFAEGEQAAFVAEKDGGTAVAAVGGAASDR